MYDPFFFSGDDHGVLLIHGFSGGPFEVRDLGGELAAAGRTVLGVRLPGHDGAPEALAVVRWADWLAVVTQAHADLAARCRRVSVVGYSLGGALAIMLAAQRPLHQLALLATPMRLAGAWRMNLLAVARHVVPWFYPLDWSDLNDPSVRAQILQRQPDLDLDDPQVQAVVRRKVKISVGAIDEVRRAIVRARGYLPRVTASTLIMHGRSDPVAPPDSAQTIHTQLGSPARELVWWDDTGHQLLTEGPHSTAIRRRVLAFMQ
jgi:carboxylesterase